MRIALDRRAHSGNKVGYIFSSECLRECERDRERVCMFIALGVNGLRSAKLAKVINTPTAAFNAHLFLFTLNPLRSFLLCHFSVLLPPFSSFFSSSQNNGQGPSTLLRLHPGYFHHLRPLGRIQF